MLEPFFIISRGLEFLFISVFSPFSLRGPQRSASQGYQSPPLPSRASSKMLSSPSSGVGFFFFNLILNFIVFLSVLKFPFGVILYLFFLCRDFSCFSVCVKHVRDCC